MKKPSSNIIEELKQIQTYLNDVFNKVFQNSKKFYTMNMLHNKANYKNRKYETKFDNE